MNALGRIRNGIHQTFAVITLLVAIYTLYQWALTILNWGDAMLMATALTWTVVTLAVAGLANLAEPNGGD